MWCVSPHSDSPAVWPWVVTTSQSLGSCIWKAGVMLHLLTHPTSVVTLLCQHWARSWGHTHDQAKIQRVQPLPASQAAGHQPFLRQIVTELPCAGKGASACPVCPLSDTEPSILEDVLTSVTPALGSGHYGLYPHIPFQVRTWRSRENVLGSQE